jgi:hypothetical protein
MKEVIHELTVLNEQLAARRGDHISAANELSIVLSGIKSRIADLEKQWKEQERLDTSEGDNKADGARFTAVSVPDGLVVDEDGLLTFRRSAETFRKQTVIWMIGWIRENVDEEVNIPYVLKRLHWAFGEERAQTATMEEFYGYSKYASTNFFRVAAKAYCNLTIKEIFGAEEE